MRSGTDHQVNSLLGIHLARPSLVGSDLQAYQPPPSACTLTVHVDRRGTASITLMSGTGSKLRARVTTAAPHRRYRSAIITFAPEKVAEGGVLLHIIDMELDGVIYPTVQAH